MARWRITMLGPTGRLGAAAIPVPSPVVGAWASRGPVNGSPGTRQIPAPYPGAVPQGRRYVTSAPQFTSQEAPGYWLPGVYWLTGEQEHPPVSVRSDNQMPIPAIAYNLTYNPPVKFMRPVFLGQTQVAQPARTVSYRNAGARPG